MNTKRLVALVAFLTSTAVGAFAVVIEQVDLGTGAPPGSINGYTMTSSFSVAGSLGTEVEHFSVGGRNGDLSPGLTLLEIGNPEIGKGWGTWSNPYAGPVLWLDANGKGKDTVKLLLPSGTLAFYLYVEPNLFGSSLFDIRATNTLGEEAKFIGETIEGFGGARGFGFYTTDSSTPLVAITVSNLEAGDMDGFALGQFGIDGIPGVPDRGATAILLVFGALALAWLRRASAR